MEIKWPSKSSDRLPCVPDLFVAWVYANVFGEMLCVSFTCKLNRWITWLGVIHLNVGRLIDSINWNHKLDRAYRRFFLSSSKCLSAIRWCNNVACAQADNRAITLPLCDMMRYLKRCTAVFSLKSYFDKQYITAKGIGYAITSHNICSSKQSAQIRRVQLNCLVAMHVHGLMIQHSMQFERIYRLIEH